MIFDGTASHARSVLIEDGRIVTIAEKIKKQEMLRTLMLMVWPYC